MGCPHYSSIESRRATDDSKLNGHRMTHDSSSIGPKRSLAAAALPCIVQEQNIGTIGLTAARLLVSWQPAREQGWRFNLPSQFLQQAGGLR